MNKKIIMIILLVITALIVVGCSSGEDINGEEISGLSSGEVTGNAVVNTWQTKSSDGTVMVDLTPEKFVDGKFIVDISVNTHSINDLNTYNLKEITALIVDWKKYKPINAPTLQGHHNNGELVFELFEEPQEFSITITDLHDVGVREFNWP